MDGLFFPGWAGGPRERGQFRDWSCDGTGPWPGRRQGRPAGGGKTASPTAAAAIIQSAGGTPRGSGRSADRQRPARAEETAAPTGNRTSWSTSARRHPARAGEQTRSRAEVTGQPQPAQFVLGQLRRAGDAGAVGDGSARRLLRMRSGRWQQRRYGCVHGWLAGLTPRSQSEACGPERGVLQLRSRLIRGPPLNDAVASDPLRSAALPPALICRNCEPADSRVRGPFLASRAATTSRPAHLVGRRLSSPRAGWPGGLNWLAGRVTEAAVSREFSLTEGAGSPSSASARHHARPPAGSGGA